MHASATTIPPPLVRSPDPDPRSGGWRSSTRTRGCKIRRRWSVTKLCAPRLRATARRLPWRRRRSRRAGRDRSAGQPEMRRRGLSRRWSNGRSWRIRAHALVALAAVDPAPAREAIDRMVASPTWQVRAYVARAARMRERFQRRSPRSRVMKTRTSPSRR